MVDLAAKVFLDAAKAPDQLRQVVRAIALSPEFAATFGEKICRPFEAVWPSDDPAGVSEEAIDDLIKRLRARLRDASDGPDYLEQPRGRGVRLRVDGN